MQSFSPYINIPEQYEQSLAEFFDDQGKVLMVGPVTQAAKLKLGYRVVWVKILDFHRRVYIRRRLEDDPEYPCLWDFSANGCVLVGESVKDTAFRLMDQLFFLTNVVFHTFKQFVFYSEGVPIFVSLYTVGPLFMELKPNIMYVEEGLLLNENELISFSVEAPELLTPGLLWAIQNDVLFMKKE